MQLEKQDDFLIITLTHARGRITEALYYHVPSNTYSGWYVDERMGHTCEYCGKQIFDAHVKCNTTMRYIPSNDMQEAAAEMRISNATHMEIA